MTADLPTSDDLALVVSRCGACGVSIIMAGKSIDTCEACGSRDMLCVKLHDLVSKHHPVFGSEKAPTKTSYARDFFRKRRKKR